MIYDRRDLLLRLSPVHCRGDQSPTEKTSRLRPKQAQTFAAECVRMQLVGKLFSVGTTADFQVTVGVPIIFFFLLEKVNINLSFN